MTALRPGQSPPAVSMPTLIPPLHSLTPMSRLPVLVAVLALAASLTSCGRDEAPPESRIAGDTLTVYSSLPLRGPLAPMARDLVRAEKLALAEADAQAGPW